MLHSLQVDFIQEDERGSTEEDELATFSWVPYSFQDSTPLRICFQGLIWSVYGYTAHGSVTPVPCNSWFMKFLTLRSTAVPLRLGR
ncbi:hypothetical protein N7450_002651 [Penicillium hetheringtonii]|uniref:Uncharacterized protein n=1 Tax=Penicillium hetheringtonii TaxID=911720 RepID=A0AAD6DWH1_9EURO|nr:hypothetical protein N7450_002651 [Penicillium hetheringtonii]